MVVLYPDWLTMRHQFKSFFPPSTVHLLGALFYSRALICNVIFCSELFSMLRAAPPQQLRHMVYISWTVSVMDSSIYLSDAKSLILYDFVCSANSHSHWQGLEMVSLCMGICMDKYRYTYTIYDLRDGSRAIYVTSCRWW